MNFKSIILFDILVKLHINSINSKDLEFSA